MAPAPTATANRPLARPSKVRYFKGKPLDEAVSDESSGEEEPQPQQRIKRVAPPVQDENVVAGGAGRVIRQGGAVGVKMDLGGVKLGGVKPPVKGEIETWRLDICDEVFADMDQRRRSPKKKRARKRMRSQDRLSANPLRQRRQVKRCALGHRIRLICSRASTRPIQRKSPRRKRSLHFVQCS